MKLKILSAFLGLGLLLNAQEPVSPVKCGLLVDVSPYAMGGYSVKGSVEGLIPKIELGFEVFALDYPSMMINLNPVNRDRKWELSTVGMALYTDYKLTDEKNNWYTGIGFVHLNETGLNETFASPINYQLFEMLLRVHYKWFPGDQDRFFLNPYFAAGGRTKIGGDEGSFGLIKGIALGSLYLGYQF
jgi:hypothetical protein